MLLVRFSGWAVLGLVVAAIPATIAEMRFSTRRLPAAQLALARGARLNYLEYVLANDEHAKEVKLFGLGPDAPRPLPRRSARPSTTRTRKLAIQPRRLGLRALAPRHRRVLRLLRADGARRRRGSASRSAT